LSQQSSNSKKDKDALEDKKRNPILKYIGKPKTSSQSSEYSGSKALGRGLWPFKASTLAGGLPVLLGARDLNSKVSFLSVLLHPCHTQHGLLRYRVLLQSHGGRASA